MFDGFITVATATPALRLADTDYNVKKCIELAESASNEGVKVLVFPELALTGYSCGDLFNTETILNGALCALREYVYGTAMIDMVSVIVPQLYRVDSF